MQAKVFVLLLSVLNVFSAPYNDDDDLEGSNDSGSGSNDLDFDPYPEPIDTNELPDSLVRLDNPDICIDAFYAAAMTSSRLWAGSSDQHLFAASFYGSRLTTREWLLYDRLGIDYLESKGDLWKLPTDRMGCIHPANVANISYCATSKDGWNIQTAFTVASLNNGRYVLLTADAGVNRWLDQDQKEHLKQFELNRFAAEPSCRLVREKCVDKLYVFALTSGNLTSGSESHNLYGLSVISDRRSEVKLYDRHGDDYLNNKADLWVLEADPFAQRNRCLKFGEIRGVSLTARSANSYRRDDEWQVQSAFVVAQLDSGKFALLTADINVHRFIGVHSRQGLEELKLTLQNC